MILLDTNVISELMRPQPDENVISWLDQQKNKDVWICSVTQAEILVGLALMPEGKRKQGLVSAATAMPGRKRSSPPPTPPCAASSSTCMRQTTQNIRCAN